MEKTIQGEMNLDIFMKYPNNFVRKYIVLVGTFPKMFSFFYCSTHILQKVSMVQLMNAARHIYFYIYIATLIQYRKKIENSTEHF